MAEKFLKELPSFNKENFSKFKSDDHTKCRKAVSYIQTKEVDDDEPQVIVTDKTNILLRYLRQQLVDKNSQSKRRGLNPSSDISPREKILRLDTDQSGND
ncbi:DET1- and DDB1-associated protein 1-like [Hydractinia symbiolongicarpus]|uniref:DET1- and DDB1-associated protein 1-like n=1 Tax=Hydractinia symbiolongicarpus TaxID=13093 RepID=UPI00254B4B08|nr:DET1- and DDB1-associated protein 1-like [Hydractinia symbiolongicarpus]